MTSSWKISEFIVIYLCIGNYLLYTSANLQSTDDDLRSSGRLRKACSTRGHIKQPSSRVNTTARLELLRRAMRTETILRDRAIDAYLITSDDEHQTEYVAPYDRRREYISGFSGSNGDAIVTQTKAALWTDGRYHLQADDQLNCDWLLMREEQAKVPSRAEWLRSELPLHGRIGADPKLVSAAEWTNLKLDLENSTLELVPISVNLIDEIWLDHEDKIINKDAFVLDMRFAGRNWTSKVEEVRQELNLLGVDAMVVTSLAEIAWLLNIRGRDIPYNPFVKSYVVLSNTSVHLYVDSSKLIANKVDKYLRIHYGINREAVIVHDYHEIWSDLPTRTQAWSYVLVPSTCAFSSGASQAIASLVPEEKRVNKPSPIISLKAKKNRVEIAGMERAHIRDGAAMCEFLEYLETRFNAGDMRDEMSIAKIINDIRFEQNFSLGNSFETIVAFGANGALPHYEPTISTNAVIYDNSTIVIDSGGQYYDGTTDVTRTLHFGEPTLTQVNAYTRVLMGLIQLSSLTFPSNMRTSLADVMARAPLWSVGLDYMHGTGHGIGSFLGVHEPPISLDYSHTRQQFFQSGNFFSNEPGYYLEGDFGVRLENILEVVVKPWYKHISGQVFLGFKDVTLVPFEPKLINISLLTYQHRQWLNDYNTRIRQLVGRELKERNKMDAFYWMMEKTKHIPGGSNRIRITSFLPFSTTIIVFWFYRC